MGCSFGAPIRNVNLLTYRADIGVAIANVGGFGWGCNSTTVVIIAKFWALQERREMGKLKQQKILILEISNYKLTIR